MADQIAALLERLPVLEPLRKELERALEALLSCFRSGGKLLVCGNGGSCADADHIVGELVKGFLSRRPLPESTRERIRAVLPEEGAGLADSLQGALPAINLAAHASLLTAFGNDVDPAYGYAQQVLAYGRREDALLGISTSGDARNVTYALAVARALGLTTLGLTGGTGGRMRRLCDVLLCVPGSSTPLIQELHLPIYHALCAGVEAALFPRGGQTP